MTQDGAANVALTRLVALSKRLIAEVKRDRIQEEEHISECPYCDAPPRHCRHNQDIMSDVYDFLDGK
jgi:hypothetical protein